MTAGNCIPGTAELPAHCTAPVLHGKNRIVSMPDGQPLVATMLYVVREMPAHLGCVLHGCFEINLSITTPTYEALKGHPQLVAVLRRDSLKFEGSNNIRGDVVCGWYG